MLKELCKCRFKKIFYNSYRIKRWKRFFIITKLKNKFSGHEIILSIDADNQISIEILNEINLNINKLVKVPDSTRGKSLNAGALSRKWLFMVLAYW